MFDSPLNDRLFAPLLLVLGAAIIVTTLLAGGGPLSTRMIFGVLFVALGGLRLWSAARRRRLDA